MTEQEMFDIIFTLFSGMGYDFATLKNSLYPSTWDKLGKDRTELYKLSIEAQIRDIENKRHIHLISLEKLLQGTSLEKYADLLFLVLAGADKTKYHPKKAYQYKKPSEKQKMLIELLLTLYPNKEGKAKPFSVNICGKREKKKVKCSMDVDNYEQQQFIFKMLKDEYFRQGLHIRYPYGEKEPPDKEHPFDFMRDNLEKQLSGDRGGYNQKHFERDLIYRLFFLMHIDEWLKTPFFDFDFEDYIEIGREILQYTFTREDAGLIGDMLFYFGLYSYTDAQNILSLKDQGQPNQSVLSDIEMMHPSYRMAEMKFLRNEGLGDY